MFSNNQKISLRQIRRLLMLDLFGISSLLLPGLLSKSAGTDGIFCIGAALVLALAYIWILGQVIKRMEGDYYSCMKKLTGTIISDLLMLFYLFFFLLLSAFVLYQLTGMVRAWLLPEGSYGVICFLVLLLAAYATIRGIEGRARIYEILFWFLLAPLLLMLALAVRGINPDYWTPVFVSSWQGFGQGTLQVFVFFLPVFFIFFLKPYCAKPEKICSCARWAVGAAAGMNGVIYLILLGNFQVKATGALARPVITLMSMVKLPGGFFARMDAFMTAIWFFSLFALMNTGVFYSSHILKELFREKKTHYSLLAVLALSFGLARWFYTYHNADNIYAWYLKNLALPVLVALPLVLLVLLAFQRRRDKGEPGEGKMLRKSASRLGAEPSVPDVKSKGLRKANLVIHRKQRQLQKVLVFLLSMFLLCTVNGCSIRELEDRGFPLAIGMDKNEDGMALSFDFPDLSEASEGKNPSGKPVSFSVEAGAYYEAQKAYENNTNKVLDYNHLKAIVISQEFAADGKALRDMLSWLEREEVVAPNTCLFFAKEQASEILTLTEETSGSVGKYLEQMVETQEDFKENKVMTIGKLMNQWHNQNEILLIPVLINNGGVPSITEYAVMDAFVYKGNISVEKAMKSFLCQNLLSHFLYRLSSGEVLEIRDIKASVKIEPEGNGTLVTIGLTGDAQVKMEAEGQTMTRGQLKKKLNRQLAASLTQTAKELLREPGMDLSNSFIRLGGYQRELYEKYNQDYTSYQENLSIQFQVDMNMINE